MSFMVLSAIFGFGFAGNMTCLSLCVRQAVPANRFGGTIGVVMMVAWAGMASGGYMGGLVFDLSLSYTLSFLLAGMAGALNLAVIGAFATTKSKPEHPFHCLRFGYMKSSGSRTVCLVSRSHFDSEYTAGTLFRARLPI